MHEQTSLFLLIPTASQQVEQHSVPNMPNAAILSSHAQARDYVHLESSPHASADNPGEILMVYLIK